VRAVAILALICGAVLLAGSVALGAHERTERKAVIDRSLVRVADGEALRLEEYFERARSINLITAQNPAFREFYALPGARESKIRAQGPVTRNAQDALGYLEQLYPASIGEVCFIDRSGAENARVVRYVRAGPADLSPNERTNPFFQPTFALPAGDVFQAKPYVSPDTHEWVISNSTPVPTAGSAAPAIVHFEITLESFRREAAAIASGSNVAIVDADAGRVIVDSRYPQRIGAPLGRPDDHRFAGLARGQRAAGVVDIDGRRSAFRRLAGTAGNANHWYVVASEAAAGRSRLGAGWAALGMLAAALALLAFAAATFRTSRRVLFDAAHSDGLTGLANRRRLMADLQAACAASGGRSVLALYDLDGFKAYNDLFGHLPGDALLRRVAQELGREVGDRGTVYRLGGDEFCLLAPLAAGETGEDLVRRGSAALSESGDGFRIGASAGAVVLPDEAASPADALATADLRMYAAKHASRPPADRQALDVLLRAQSECSPSLAPHTSDVGELAVAIGRRLGLDDPALRLLHQAGELHDIGKLAVPAAILDKPGRLTDDEWELMREHTLIGERILAAAPALRDVAAVVRSSHERFDGSGYPDGLAGDAIPLEARIVFAADAVCAMTSHRPYHTARSLEGAIDELQRHRGGQFDPVVVDVLVETLRERAAASRADAVRP
jgi:diguanylate cyclase (GGDEF)-like protein